MHQQRADGGQIGVTLRIGVTGHRTLDDIDTLRQDVRLAVDQVVAALPRGAGSPTPIRLAVVSSLAEGADRLVAKELLEQGAELEVILPLPADDYATDFATPHSRDEFTSLRQLARQESVMAPTPTRNRAYLLAGQAVVRRCDLLIALWDGEEARGEGGTAEIVAFARELLVPLVWISTDGRHRVTPMVGDDAVGWERLGPLTSGAFAELDRYNEPLRDAARFDAASAHLAQGIRPPEDRPDTLGVAAATAWIAPFFARAELQANRFEAWYKRVGTTLFLMSFLAVATVAAQEVFFSHHIGVAWAEVALLAAIGAGLMLARQARLHERWITARYLGEALRSAVFLAIAGIGDQEDRPALRLMDDEPTDEWMRRAFAEVWEGRPTLGPTEADVGPLQRFLAEAWIGDQAGYHERTAVAHSGRQRLFTWSAYAFFALSLVSAVLHSSGITGDRTPKQVWEFASIVVPAAAAALSGLAAQREYHQHGQRYRRMARHLRSAATQMRAAQDLAEVQQLAIDTERAMRDESGQWFGVVRLHDLELPG